MLTSRVPAPRKRTSIFLIIVGLSVLISACGYRSASYVAKGEEYLAKRKFHDALMQFRSAVESDPSSAKAHWGLARTYEALGQFNEVIDELRKTTELDEANLEAKTKLGTYFLLVQPPLVSETEKIRDEVLAANPNFIEGHILTASIMAAQGKPDTEVVAAVNHAIDLNPQRIESYISLERLYTTREKIDDAEAALKRGLNANPSSVTGYTEYGRFLMYANRDPEAEAQFNKAISLDPNNIEARETAAEFFVNSKQYEKAENAYRQLIAVEENSPESRLELAEFYDKTDRKDEAIDCLTQILADSPGYAMARYKLGQIYLDRRDIAKVDEQLDELFKINSGDTEALMIRAKVRMQENKPEEAVKDLEDVLKKYPSAEDPLFLMSQARIATGQIDMANAFIADLEKYHPNFLRAGLLHIQAAVATGDAQAALKMSNDLMAKCDATSPNAETDAQTIQDLRVKAWSSRGLAYLDLGKLPEAKYDLSEVLNLSPKSAAAMVNLAKVFNAQKDFSGAIDLYEKALATDARNFDAMTGIVNSTIAMGQPAKAHTRIAALMDVNAGKADVLAGLHFLNSNVFSTEKNIASAQQELTTAINLDPDYMPAYSSMATIFASQNRVDDAIAQYQVIIAKRPAAQPYTMLGILEEQRGNAQAAEANYRHALEITPETPIAANNLACLILDNQGNLDEALQLATLAVNKGQNVASFLDTLGWVYLQKGLSSPAVEQLRKAVALEEQTAKSAGRTPNPSYRVRLGMALAKAGDKANARKEVETGLKAEDLLSQKEARDAKSLLATL